MFLYFLILRIAALFGHRKARLLVRGQAAAIAEIKAKDLKNPIWIHAASVGEFEQIRPIIERIRLEHPSRQMLLTFFSPSGYEMRKGYDRVDLVTYLPFATRRQARAFLDAVQPSMSLIVKYEFWPAYLRELKKRDIPTYSVASIFRSKQAFFRPWGVGYRRLLKCFTCLFVQDEESANLLHSIGVDQVLITGDTRFDRVCQIASAERSLPVVEQFVQGAERIIVAGSTWPKDEALLARYLDEHPDTKMILVPHEIHEEHLHYIFNLLQGHMVRYTQANTVNVLHAQTLVVDTMGMLSTIYRYGHVAYIGGGFGDGIHNTLEAAVYGMPVVWGPRYQRFREAYGLMVSGGGFTFKNYAELEAVLNKTLTGYRLIGPYARKYVESELGATQRIYQALEL